MLIIDPEGSAPLTDGVGAGVKIRSPGASPDRCEPDMITGVRHLQPAICEQQLANEECG
jgi:hypothetical protein